MHIIFTRIYLSVKVSKAKYAVIFCLALSGCALGPDPIKPAEHKEAIEARLFDLGNTPRPQGKQISLSEAVARAVRYNWAERVQAYQAVLENTQIDLANMAMIPDLLSNSGYRFRNPEYASQNPQRTSVVIAEQQNRRLQDFTFSWSLLDFGLSYFRARQQADRAMIAVEQERKVRQQIVQDTIIAWYRARAERRIREEYEPLLVKANAALQRAVEIEKARLQEPMEALAYQRDVLDTIQNIESWKKDLAGSEFALANMIGLASQPGIVAGEEDIEIASSRLSRSQLQATALMKRTDIEIALYETRISRREALIALLELAPIPSFTLGNNYDSNNYLVYNQWMALGGQIAINLAKLARYPSVSMLNNERIGLAQEKAVAVISAALLQVDIAYAQLKELEKYLHSSEQALAVSERMARQVHAAFDANQIGQIQALREDLRSFLSKVRRDIAKIEERSAGARLMASVGVDFSPASSDDIENSSKEIRASVSYFQKGGGKNVEDIVGSDLVNKASHSAENVPQMVRQPSPPTRTLARKIRSNSGGPYPSLRGSATQ